MSVQTPLKMRFGLLAELAPRQTPRLSRKVHATRRTSFLNLLLQRPHDRPDHFKRVQEHAKKGNINAAVEAYKKAVAEVEASLSLPSTSKSVGAPSDPQHVMRLLVQPQQISDKTYHFVRRIFNDLDRRFGITPTLADHRILMTAMINAGRLDDATRWLSNMRQSYNLTPELEDYNRLLRAFRKLSRNPHNKTPIKNAGLVESVENIIKAMRKDGVTPNIDSFNVLISALFSAGKPAEVDKLVMSLEKEKIERDSWTWTALLQGYTDAGLKNKAETAFRKIATLQTQADEARPHVTNAITHYLGTFQGQPAMFHFLKTLPSGQTTDSRTYSLLVEHDRSSLYATKKDSASVERIAGDAAAMADSILDRASKAISRHSTVAALQLLMDRLVREAATPEIAVRAASLFYDRIRKTSDHSADPRLVQTLLDAVAASAAGINLGQVQSLYYDLVNPDTAAPDAYPTPQLFNTLLGICAQCSSAGVAWAIELLGDMREEGLNLDSASTAASHTTALMRACDSYTQAFSIYSWLRAVTPKPFTRVQYNTFLSQFAKLQFRADDRATKSTRDEAPPELFNEFVKDMRQSGNPPDTATYSILLSYYSRQSRNPDQIRKLHAAIKMDAQYDPDTALLNSLIVAYGYVRDFPAAFGVWKAMLANNHRSNARIDHVTISAVLDVCASTRSFTTAHKVWSTICNDLPIKPNRRNWETWLECLCRCGAYESAADIVFNQMVSRQEPSDVPSVDSTALEILLTLAHRNNSQAYSEILARAKIELPHILGQLKLPTSTSVGRPDLADGETIGMERGAGRHTSEAPTTSPSILTFGALPFASAM